MNITMTIVCPEGEPYFEFKKNGNRCSPCELSRALTKSKHEESTGIVNESGFPQLRWFQFPGGIIIKAQIEPINPDLMSSHEAMKTLALNAYRVVSRYKLATEGSDQIVVWEF